MTCPYCTNNHTPEACPRVAVIEYHYNGTIKRVEFVSVPKQAIRLGPNGMPAKP